MPRARKTTNQRMEFLPADQANFLSSPVLDRGLITACRVNVSHHKLGFIEPPTVENAFQLAFQLRATKAEFWVDGTRLDFNECPAGHFTFFDYRHSWQANLNQPFDCINFHVPMSASTVFKDDLGPGRLERLNIRPGTPVDDPTVRGLAMALAPVFQAPENASQLFFDHISLALALHLSVTYGEASVARLHSSGGLSKQKLNLALQMLDTPARQNVSLTAVSEACGMSVVSFARAFKASTGMPPYRWFNNRRIERAKALLERSVLPLNRIALEEGFSSQAHFSRLFAAATGMTPSEWRAYFK